MGTDSSIWCRRTLLVLLAGSGGCMTATDATPLHDAASFLQGRESDQKEEEHRSRYSAWRDGVSIRWLMAHKVHNGLQVEEVNRILGEQGVRENNDLGLKKPIGPYELDDEIIRYGPDHLGRVYLLGFRRGDLVGFNPTAYLDPE